jgi:hypothetical protein
MAQIENAVISYRSQYNDLPLARKALNAGHPDFTFGTHGLDLPISIPRKAAGHQANNSELLAVLMDLEAFRNGQPTVNTNHVLNCRKSRSLMAGR